MNLLHDPVHMLLPGISLYHKGLFKKPTSVYVYFVVLSNFYGKNYQIHF